MWQGRRLLACVAIDRPLQRPRKCLCAAAAPRRPANAAPRLCPKSQQALDSCPQTFLANSLTPDATSCGAAGSAILKTGLILEKRSLWNSRIEIIIINSSTTVKRRHLFKSVHLHQPCQDSRMTEYIFQISVRYGQEWAVLVTGVVKWYRSKQF